VERLNIFHPTKEINALLPEKMIMKKEIAENQENQENQKIRSDKSSDFRKKI